MNLKIKITVVTMLSIPMLGLMSNNVLANNAPQQGVLISDMSLDALYLTRDLNGNGHANDFGEATVYFDEFNLSGLATPTNSVYSIFQSYTGHIYIGDGASDSVYRLSDWNADGDAQDAGEAVVWFSEDNASGYTLPTPNSVHEAQDGALYIVNAGTRSRPADAVYRTVDLNNDGDANDANEAQVWLDLSTLASDTVGGGVPENRSSAFDITFVGDTAYIADLMGGESDTIFVAHDDNNNGVIDEGELNVFIDDDNEFGVSVATGLISDDQGNIYTLESLSSRDQSVYKLNDLNGNGVIDNASEVQEIWNEALVAGLGVQLGNAFSLAIGENGELIIVSAGSDVKDNVFRLVDLNGDGDYLDDGETILWVSANGDDFVEFARTAEFITITSPVPFPPSLFVLFSGLGLLMLSARVRRGLRN